MPQLLDPNFRRAVILLVHHDDEGTFGLVVNRSADIPTSDLCTTLGIEWRGDRGSLVGVGGPVQPNTGWLLFADKDFTEGSDQQTDTGVTEVCENFFCAGSLDALRSVAGSAAQRARLFLGYAGWGAGQLEQELAQGAWLIAPASPEIVFDVSPEAMWEYVLRRLGVDPATLVATPGIH